MRARTLTAGFASVALAGCLAGAALTAPLPQLTSDALASQPSQATSAADTSAADETSYAEAQSIGLEGVNNARQLGGYVGADGRAVKDGLLLRTAKLSGATKQDIETLLDTYNLGYICNFRTTSEREQAPDPEIDGVQAIWCSILDEDGALGSVASGVSSPSADDDGTASSSGTAVVAGKAATGSSLSGSAGEASPSSGSSDSSESGDAADARAQAMRDTVAQLVAYGDGMDLSDMYVDIADSEHSQQGYREFFDVLLGNTDGKAVLWHCTAGKDHAGFGAALLLSALGVDRQTVLDDFELTNTFNQQKIDAMAQFAQQEGYTDEEVQTVRTLMGVDRAYMEKALDHIDEEYGSMHDYLVDEIGLTDEEIAQLQDMYLE